MGGEERRGKERRRERKGAGGEKGERKGKGHTGMVIFRGGATGAAPPQSPKKFCSV